MDNPKIMIGQIIYNRRYAKPVNLKGSKISSLQMKRTQSLKFKKINESKTARSHFIISEEEDKIYKPDLQQKTPFIFSHSKILRKSLSQQKQVQKKMPNFIIQSKNYSRYYKIQQQKQQQHKTKTYFYSNNLNKIKNIEMNKLFNNDEDMIYLQEQSGKDQKEIFKNNTTYNTKHQFWRKMKKSMANKRMGEQIQVKVKAQPCNIEYFYFNMPKIRNL